MLQRLTRQFSAPEGPLGYVAGWLMTRRNGPANAWIVELLDAGAQDRVLEIGFGPGLAVCDNARRAAFVAGVDRSELMVRKARARVQRAMPGAAVDLRAGTVEALPFTDGAFTRAMTVNSLRFWPDVPRGLRELARVLVPGARLVVALRMDRPDAGRFDASRCGSTEAYVAEVADRLRGAGFVDIDIDRREIGGERVAALVARRARGGNDE
jgi:ubiquinone/menaquinone biosynthesis C-methylase UbiE